LQLGVTDSLGFSLYGHAGSGGMVVDGSLLANDTYFNLSDIITAVPESSNQYVHNTLHGATSDIATNLGINIGDDYWFLPQTSLGAGSSSTLHAPYLGLGTESMNYGVFQGDVVNLTLLAMSGPTGGQFSLQQSGTWLMRTTDGITSDDAVIGFPVGGHDHYKWFFSKPGVYDLTFQSSATRISTGLLETSVDTYKFLVGSTVWKGTNGSNWNNSANWVSGLPASGATVIFSSSTDPNQPLTQDIAAPLDLHGVIFTAKAGAYTLGGQTLRLSVDSPEITSESASNQVIGNPLVLATDTIVTVNGSGNVTLSGLISGGGSFTKTGSGSLILAYNASHTGETLIKEGVLALNATGQIEYSAIANSATFEILAGDHSIASITGNGATVVLAGSLTVDSIVQNTVTLAPGTRVIIAPLPGGPLGSCLTPVPEPSSWILLVCAIVSSMLIYFQGRNSQP
jgi:surface-anchored protein